VKPYPSPFMTCLLTTGIVFFGAFPPIGLILVGLAIAEQRRHNGRHARAYRAEVERIRQRDLDRVWRYFR
jgi:hypothetical protein